MKVAVRTGDPVPVLPAPDATAGDVAGVVIGTLAGGVTVDIAEIVTNGSARWAKLPLIAGDVQLLRSGTQETLFGYVAGENFIGGLQPAAQPNVSIGLSVIYQRDAAHLAAQKGCRFFSIIGHVELASEIKAAYPDAMVMIRPYIDIRGALPSVDYVLGRLNGASDPGLIYSGINEADQVGQDANGIRLRAAFDVEMAQRIKAKNGAIYAAGSFSMGTPDITNAGICDAMRQYYAPHFNSGLLWWDQHLYSPNLQHIYREDTQTPIWNDMPQVIVEHEWYETRWHFFYTRCGFDPKSPSRIVSSEIGMDEGGVGGFPAHNTTNQDVANWCKRYIQIQSLPLNIGGAQYPPTFVGGAIFQIGDPVKWADYDMTRYLDAMRSELWLPSQVFIPRVTGGSTNKRMDERINE